MRMAQGGQAGGKGKRGKVKRGYGGGARGEGKGEQVGKPARPSTNYSNIQVYLPYLLLTRLIQGVKVL